MKRIMVSLVAAVLLMVGASSSATAASASSLKFNESAKVLNAALGKVSVAVQLRVNGRLQPVKLTSASFVPADKWANACGTALKATTNGAGARFVAPHPGPNALRTVVTARSVRKISGRYVTKKLTRTVKLGGTGYQCTHASPPPASAVCDFGVPGKPSYLTGSTSCGIPVASQPFFLTKPTMTGSTVTIPRLGVPSGYCWTVYGFVGNLPLSHPNPPANWFGGKMTYANEWECTGSITLAPDLGVTLTAPDSASGSIECQTDDSPAHESWGGLGTPWTFQVPGNIGGRLDVEWSFYVFSRSGTQLGSEWSSASFNLTGTADGCSQLQAPATRG